MATTAETLTQASQVAKSFENAASAAQAAVNSSAFVVNLFGYTINLMTVLLLTIIVSVGILAYRIQSSGKLDFADMITKDGRKVSSTKVMQFLGGIASTWFVVKQGLAGTLSSEIFGIYLVYCASIEGFSKFISAKYNYSETSVRDAVPGLPVPQDGPIEETSLKASVSGDGEIKTIEQTTVKKG